MVERKVRWLLDYMALAPRESRKRKVKSMSPRECVCAWAISIALGDEVIDAVQQTQHTA